MQRIADLKSFTTESQVLQLASLEMCMKPIGEDPLFGCPELSGPGQNPATVNPNWNLKSSGVFLRKALRRKLGCSVE
jgi:hypothetical protein